MQTPMACISQKDSNNRNDSTLLFHCLPDPCHSLPSRRQQDLNQDSGKHKRPAASDHIKGIEQGKEKKEGESKLEYRR